MTTNALNLAMALICVALSVEAHAQGSRTDYERANSLDSRTANTVFRDSVKPHWAGDRPEFWYEILSAPEARDYIRVNAATGERRALFDSARLVAALGNILGKTIPPTNLALQTVQYDFGTDTLHFRCEGRGWNYAIQGNQLSADEHAETSTAPRWTHRKRTRRTGEATTITFINHHTEAAEIFWMDPDENERSYGTIAAGAEKTLSTYAGHVWQLVGPGKTAWGFFEAVETPSRAILDDSPAPEPATPSVQPETSLPGVISPDGQWSLQIVTNNVHLHHRMPAEEVTVTTDGTDGNPYTDAIVWSPDSRHAALLRVEPAQSHVVYRVESSPKDRIEPRLHQQNYLKPGDRVARAQPCLFQLEPRKLATVSNRLCENPYELGDVRWSHDSSRFTMEYNQRGHQIYRVLAVDAITAEVTPIIEETSRTFIDYSGKHFLHWHDLDHTALWMSERDGWNHLWRYDTLTGKVINPVTRGEWVVRQVLEVNDATGEIWFMAGGVHPGEDPYHTHLCRVKSDGTGFVILTEGDGTHHIEFSPDHQFFIDQWSRVDFPPVTELRRVSDGHKMVELERANVESLLSTGWVFPERFTAKGRDGTTDIHGIIVRPSQFSPDQHYPVVEEVYAGPQDAYVPKAFGREIRLHTLAELGFIVVQVDGMGTSQRSKTFHDVCWKNLADGGFADRIAWVRAAAATRPWMDLKRVGIVGGSAGGQNALRALIDHSDFYHVAVADCGCHDNRMDKIWWNEQWMGWPVGPEYNESSNVTQAHRMRGNLLLVVGEMDTNVDPSSTFQVVNALEKADLDFELLVMTGTGHGAAESSYGRRRRMDFLVRHLWGREPRWQ